MAIVLLGRVAGNACFCGLFKNNNQQDAIPSNPKIQLRRMPFLLRIDIKHAPHSAHWLGSKENSGQVALHAQGRQLPSCPPGRRQPN